MRCPFTPPNRYPLRRQVLLRLAVVVAVAAPIGSSCGDDARTTTPAHRLVIEPCEGAEIRVASAAAVAPDLLATAAHGLVEAAAVEVADAEGRPVGTTVVHIDPVKDIALLRSDRPLAAHLDLAPPPADGGPVGILSYTTVDGPEIESAEIVELVDVTLDGEGRRAAVRLAADIGPGDSGAAVVDRDGRMVAMVFATARRDEFGWAVSSTEVTAAIESLGRDGTEQVLPAC